MAVGNQLVAVSQTGLDESDEAASNVREAGVRSLIRQRLKQDSKPASERPCKHHTDSYSAHLADSGACTMGDMNKEGSGFSKQREWLQQGQSNILNAMLQPSSCQEASLQEDHLTCTTAANATDHDAQELVASASQRLEDASICGIDTAGSQPDGTPKLLKRPHKLSHHQEQLDGDQDAPTESSAFDRMQAAAPHYAQAVQSEQLQVAGSNLHGHLAMPYSHLLCLWAIKLVLPHPVTQKMLKLSIPDPPVFDQVRVAEARMASHVNFKEH